jgi:hypothetical protein
MLVPTQAQECSVDLDYRLAWEKEKAAEKFAGWMERKIPLDLGTVSTSMSTLPVCWVGVLRTLGSCPATNTMPTTTVARIETPRSSSRILVKNNLRESPISSKPGIYLRNLELRISRRQAKRRIRCRLKTSSDTIFDKLSLEMLPSLRVAQLIVLQLEFRCHHEIVLAKTLNRMRGQYHLDATPPDEKVRMMILHLSNLPD